MTKQKDLKKALKRTQKNPSKAWVHCENLFISLLVVLQAVSLIYSSVCFFFSSLNSHETCASVICSPIIAVIIAIITGKTKMQIKDQLS